MQIERNKATDRWILVERGDVRCNAERTRQRTCVSRVRFNASTPHAAPASSVSSSLLVRPCASDTVENHSKRQTGNIDSIIDLLGFDCSRF
jgi:hypothetical protein